MHGLGWQKVGIRLNWSSLIVALLSWRLRESRDNQRDSDTVTCLSRHKFSLPAPVVMYGCESWTIKKAQCQRTDAFELECWRRFLRVPQTARR